jgi:hypothetical protein
MTGQDGELISALAELNTATATFSTDLFVGELDREAHVVMAMMLLDVADRVLKRLVEGYRT